jgi:hypothetical protein
MWRLKGAVVAGFSLSVVVPLWGQTHWGFYTPRDQKKPVAAGREIRSTDGLQVTEAGRVADSDTPAVRRVSVPSINGGTRTLVDEETEVVPSGPGMQRRIHRIYGQDPDGRRQLIAVEETTVRTLASGKVETVTTYSQRDANGRFALARREISTTIPRAPGRSHTETVVLVPGPYGALAPQLRFLEDEEHDGQVSRSRRERLVPDGNGRWVPNQMTETIKQSQNGAEVTEERLYAVDANGALTLARRTVDRKQSGPEGTGREEQDVYMVAPGSEVGAQGGGLVLMQRTRTLRTRTPTGEVVTRQQIEERSPVAMAEGLRVTGAVVEVEHRAPDGTVRSQQTVLATDGNQQLRTVRVFEKQGGPNR